MLNGDYLLLAKELFFKVASGIHILDLALIQNVVELEQELLWKIHLYLKISHVLSLFSLIQFLLFEKEKQQNPFTYARESFIAKQNKISYLIEHCIIILKAENDGMFDISFKNVHRYTSYLQF